jgi:2-polyprenyl-6-hydroxyphenyl methylase/3-demethylubiquinone-9 3-methyltransferase
MNMSLDNVAPLVAPGGTLFISIYNDQGIKSLNWTRVKKVYCSGLSGRMLVRAIFYPYFAMGRLLADLMKLRNPLTSYGAYKSARGMSVVHDWEDWLGGYPFEVAKPEVIFDRFAHHGFILRKLRSCGGGLGCNEFVFSRPIHH